MYLNHTVRGVHFRLPSISTSGANTAGAMINGKVWIAKNDNPESTFHKITFGRLILKVVDWSLLDPAFINISVTLINDRRSRIELLNDCC